MSTKLQKSKKDNLMITTRMMVNGGDKQGITFWHRFVFCDSPEAMGFTYKNFKAFGITNEQKLEYEPNNYLGPLKGRTAIAWLEPDEYMGRPQTRSNRFYPIEENVY